MAEGYEIRRRRPSFRGIPIEFMGATREGGRRAAVHTFGERDLPYTEDRGRAVRRFRVRGVFVGADHDLEAKRLEDAFEAEGPGELILPHRAPIMVVVESFNIEEPARETRVQRWEASFVEAGTPVAPTTRANTAGIVQAAVERAVEAVRERVGAVISIKGQTAAQVARLLEVTAAAAAVVEQGFKALRTATQVVEELAEVSQSIDGLSRRIAGQIVDAGLAARSMQNAFDDVLALPFAPLDVYRELKAAADFGNDLSSPGSQTIYRAQVAANSDAWVALVRHSATATRAKALSLSSFRSATQAAEYRNEIAAELDRAILEASDAFAYDVAQELRAVRTATIRDLDARSAKLPARVTFTTDRIYSSLVLSQRLYGTPDRESEILERNRSKVRNSGRIPFGSALEVLTDA